MAIDYQGDQGERIDLCLKVIAGQIDVVLEKEGDAARLTWMSDVLQQRIVDGNMNSGQLANFRAAFIKVSDKLKVVKGDQSKLEEKQGVIPETKEQRKIRALKRIDKFLQYFDGESGQVVGHSKESLEKQRRDAENNLKMMIDLDENELSIWLHNLEVAKDSKKLPVGILGVALIGMTSKRDLRSNLQDTYIETIEILIGKK